MVITISNLYGCGALAVAQRVSEALGYELVDQQLPVVVAKRLNTTARAVESAEDAQRSVSERILRGLELGTPETGGALDAPFDDACLQQVREAVREYAARGDAVIMGRGSGAILGRRAGVIRVFMHAPRDRRVAHIMEALRVTESAAAAEVDRIDRAREEYLRRYYRVTQTDALACDLSLDTSAFGVERSAGIIVQSAR